MWRKLLLLTAEISVTFLICKVLVPNVYIDNVLWAIL